MLERIGKVAYRIRLPPSMQQHPVLHVSLLQRDKPRPQEMFVEDGWEPVDPGRQGQDPEYEVEILLDRKGDGSSEWFLVKGKGFPESQATWKPVANLANSQGLIRAFRQTEARRQRQNQDNYSRR